MTGSFKRNPPVSEEEGLSRPRGRAATWMWHTQSVARTGRGGGWGGREWRICHRVGLEASEPRAEGAAARSGSRACPDKPQFTCGLYWAVGVCLSCTTERTAVPHSSICSAGCPGGLQGSLVTEVPLVPGDRTGWSREGLRCSDCAVVSELRLSRYSFLCLCFTVFKMAITLLLLGCRACLMGFVKSFETLEESERMDECMP